MVGITVQCIVIPRLYVSLVSGPPGFGNYNTKTVAEVVEFGRHARLKIS